ncbi:PREDICTED: uncharacterized protein LOC108760594 [Trachymyrmex cornetzi]|uniref:uncharacterized protein LOC108760594 n=1 Tax=Trachymyrmex cornetzi TaxID=471704 RepID=UPI00084F4035|nr:PREDICTED: uncharacterized protein LOC108760594 [Trachymyrmex cornetzi]
MSDGRKRLSGSQYNKLRQIKKLKEEIISNKTSKIDIFFKPLNEFVKVVQQNADPDINSESYVTSSSYDTIDNAYADQILPSDPVEWPINDYTRDYVAMYGYKQNKNADFSKSKRQYTDKTRMLTKNIFNRKLANGELQPRSWLVYSESTGHIFCEKGIVLGRVDKHLIQQLDEEMIYWRKVLHRVVVVIKTLASRGLSFRGHEEKFGSNKNGNYMMLLEIIAHKVVSKIIDEIRDAKYFSIIVDSTPDISHIDQLSFVVRYINKSGLPVERFIKFIPNTGHKAEDIFNVVITTLETYKLDINDCRGQSYDNASNMSGVYSGFQARIKNVNSLANFNISMGGPTKKFFTCLNIKVNFIEESFSNTWSARDDARKALMESWSVILNAIIALEQDSTQKASTRTEAKALHLQLERLETAFMATF